MTVISRSRGSGLVLTACPLLLFDVPTGTFLQSLDPPLPLLSRAGAGGLQRQRLRPEQHPRAGDDGRVFEATPCRVIDALAELRLEQVAIAAEQVLFGAGQPGRVDGEVPAEVDRAGAGSRRGPVERRHAPVGQERE